MSIDLPSDLVNEIQRHVATVVFTTPDEVVREALMALRARNEELKRQREEVNEALCKATADLKAGRFRLAAGVSRNMRRKFNLPE